MFSKFNEGVELPLDLKTFRGWLKYLGELFVTIRYPFEEFREMSMEDYEAKLKRFLMSEADDYSDASIVYHLDRVQALYVALRAYAEEIALHGGTPLDP